MDGTFSWWCDVNCVWYKLYVSHTILTTLFCQFMIEWKWLHVCSGSFTQTNNVYSTRRLPRPTLWILLANVFFVNYNICCGSFYVIKILYFFRNLYALKIQTKHFKWNPNHWKIVDQSCAPFRFGISKSKLRPFLNINKLKPMSKQAHALISKQSMWSHWFLFSTLGH